MAGRENKLEEKSRLEEKERRTKIMKEKFMPGARSQSARNGNRRKER